MAAIDIDGGVPSTTLNGAITSGATSITLASGASYPDGTNGNFYVVVDLGAATEETIECSARSSNTLTVATRGADGTSAAGHDNGATVQHVVPALTLQEANTHANTTTGTPHGSAYVVPSGNVATATALATARTIVLSGDVSGTSGSFDGTANATITTTIADDSHNHTDSTITGTLSNDTSGNAATATVLATARTIGGVSFNGSANINLPGVNATGSQDTTGTALTATGLETARTIGGVSFDGTANINLPGVNTAGTVDTSGTAAVATAATLTDAGSDTTCFPVLAGAATGNEGLETDASALTYNASNGTLSATNLAGTLTTAAQANITSVGTLTGLTNSGGDITNANNYYQTAGVTRNNADQDWALRVGNDAAVTTPDNKAVIGVVWDSNHGSAASMGISLMYNESASTKTYLKFQYSTGIDGGAIQSNGTTVAFVQPSDIRYKENITSVSGAVDALKGVDVISYNRIGHDVTRVGFSAQNVQSIPEFAEFVRTEEGDDDGRLHLAESEFVPYLVKAVQELTARLEAVEG